MSDTVNTGTTPVFRMLGAVITAFGAIMTAIIVCMSMAWGTMRLFEVMFGG